MNNVAIILVVAFPIRLVRLLVENIFKIKEIVESDGRVSTSSIAQEQNIAQTTGWYRLSKVGGYKKSSVLGCEYRKTP